MPELPEVETIRLTLKQFVIGKTINHITIYWPNIIKYPDDTEMFKQMLKGQTFRDIRRKGKFLLFYLDDVVLVSHLRMEGKYSVESNEEPLKKHTHVIFSFTDGTELRYNDVRKFGTMHVYAKGYEWMDKPLSALGPDGLDETFTYTFLYEKLQKTTRSIKTCLLDQSIVAGLGNIYVDETLFKASVYPLKRADELTTKEVQAIRDAAVNTLREAVELGGTTIRSYTNSQGEMGMFQQTLYVYGKEDEPCQICGTPIVKMKIGGRGSHICPQCQKK